jgi:hypothetical protein
MTWTLIGTPIVRFATVPDPLKRSAANLNIGLPLCVRIIRHGDYRLTMRLSDVGLRQRQTQLIYPGHRPFSLA